MLLARVCKAGVNLATAGQGRRQFLSCEVDGCGPFLFAAISDQCARGSHLRNWRKTFDGRQWDSSFLFVVSWMDKDVLCLE